MKQQLHRISVGSPLAISLTARPLLPAGPVVLVVRRPGNPTVVKVSLVELSAMQYVEALDWEK